MPATILLKGFGFSTDDLLKMYYPVEEVRVSKGVLLRKLDPAIHTGLRATADIVDKSSGELLAKEGMKLNKTLMGRVRSAGIKEIPIKSEDLVGRAVLTELVDPESQEVLLEKNQRLTCPCVGDDSGGAG